MFYGDMRIYYIRHMRHSTSTHINLIFDSSRELERFNDSSTSAHTHSVITKPPIQTRRQTEQRIFRFINIIHLFIYHFTCHHFCYHLFALHARESNLCHQTIKCGIYYGKIHVPDIFWSYSLAIWFVLF